MKKTYNKPVTITTKIHSKSHLLAGSGVANGSTLGDAYSSSDVSYSRGVDLWFDEEEE